MQLGTTTMRCVTMSVVSGFLLGGDDASKIAVKKALKDLQGTWSLVSLERDGRRMPAEQTRDVSLVIQGDQYKLQMPAPPLSGIQTVEKGMLRIDPSKNPAMLIFLQEDRKEDASSYAPGIYKLAGDSLTICEAPAEKEPPKEFTGKARKKLSVWKRKKA